MALEPEVQRIVLLDGPAFLGDPSNWASQSNCLQATLRKIEALIAQKIIKDVDAEAAARLLNGAALSAALWIAASDDPKVVLSRLSTHFVAWPVGCWLHELAPEIVVTVTYLCPRPRVHETAASGGS